jgi:hypothetical protein
MKKSNAERTGRENPYNARLNQAHAISDPARQ